LESRTRKTLNPKCFQQSASVMRFKKNNALKSVVAVVNGRLDEKF